MAPSIQSFIPQSQVWFGTLPLQTFFTVLSPPNPAGSQMRTTGMRLSLFASINGLRNNTQLYLIQEAQCCKQVSLGNRLIQVTPDHFLVLHVHEKIVSRISCSTTFAGFEMRPLSTEMFCSIPFHSKTNSATRQKHLPIPKSRVIQIYCA